MSSPDGHRVQTGSAIPRLPDSVRALGKRSAGSGIPEFTALQE